MGRFPYRTLIILDEALRVRSEGGCLRFMDIAKLLGISKGSVRNILRRIEGEGLIRRVERDGYTCYEITDKGVNYIMENVKKHLDYLGDYLENSPLVNVSETPYEQPINLPDYVDFVAIDSSIRDKVDADELIKQLGWGSEDSGVVVLGDLGGSDKEALREALGGWNTVLYWDPYYYYLNSFKPPGINTIIKLGRDGRTLIAMSAVIYDPSYNNPFINAYRDNRWATAKIALTDAIWLMYHIDVMLRVSFNTELLINELVMIVKPGNEPLMLTRTFPEKTSLKVFINQVIPLSNLRGGIIT
jgi:DNA-binding MarR family transcriptional regulator